MSIKSEITRIAGNVSDALDAIANKGVTVPVGSNSDDLATLIAQITGGGPTGPYYYVWQDGDGYIRLSDTMPSAAVSGEVLQLPGNLLKLALAEQMVQTDGETMTASTQLITRGDS